MPCAGVSGRGDASRPEKATVRHHFTTANTVLPKAEAKYSPQGMGYVGAPNHAAGLALGTEAAKRAGIKAGDVALVWGLKGHGGDRGARTVGEILSLEKAGDIVI